MLKVSNTPQGEWRDAIANHNRTLSVTLNPDGQTYTLAEGSGPTTAVRGGTLYFTMIPKTSNDPAGKEQYFSASGNIASSWVAFAMLTTMSSFTPKLPCFTSKDT